MQTTWVALKHIELKLVVTMLTSSILLVGRVSSIDILQKNCRLYLPRRVLSTSNCGNYSHDYPELGTRFKAAHVKTMCWWIGYKLELLSRETAPCFKYLSLKNCAMYFANFPIPNHPFRQIPPSFVVLRTTTLYMFWQHAHGPWQGL